MAERDTVTGPGPELDPSALAWVGKWLQSDRAARGPASGEPVTRSLNGSVSTGVNTTDLAVTPVLFGHYELLEKIGQGGMGSVYRVRNLELDRHEALKLIAPRNSDDSAARTRFEREFLSLAKIEHPHIVPVYAAGAWEGVPYFTMKYVPGGALSKHLDRFRMDPAATARLMAKVARAVQKLHQAGVLHRDLKPHNILLGDGDEPLVADFGLVKKLGEDSDASVTGAPMGTRQYMSPEQTFAQKADYTPACDVWAIGVILYELLAAERPFPSTDPVEVYMQIRSASPVPIMELNPAAPGPLAAVAHRCIAKAPADRYPTAAAVADDLEAWLAGDAITATLPPPTRKPRRRWPGWVAVGVVSAAVVTGIIAARTDPPTPTNPPASALLTPIPELEPTAKTPIVAPMPSPARTIADRIREGETVTLIGPTGLPTRPTRQLPQSTADLTTTAAETCVLPGFEFAAVELLNEPLPFPVRFSAEIDLGAYRPTSWGGLYAGGVSWDGAGARFQNVVAATVQYDTPFADGDEIVTPVKRSAEVIGWTEIVSARGREVASFPPGEARRPNVTKGGHNWQKVSLTVSPFGLDVEAGGFVRPIDWAAKVVRPGRVNFARTPAHGAWTPPPPTPGDGIGLIVVQAQLFVRNVTVSTP